MHRSWRRVLLGGPLFKSLKSKQFVWALASLKRFERSSAERHDLGSDRCRKRGGSSSKNVSSVEPRPRPPESVRLP